MNDPSKPLIKLPSLEYCIWCTRPHRMQLAYYGCCSQGCVDEWDEKAEQVRNGADHPLTLDSVLDSIVFGDPDE